jgi:2-polyprenyl-3-methyl-5-hydroxy-6-metoxy-1,4-benzoquinol methylase
MDTQAEVVMQKKSSEWYEQWTMFKAPDRLLLEQWIAPATMEDFRGKDVLECGCGAGQHTNFISPFAKSITAVDLNTSEIASQENRHLTNAAFLEADIATMDLGRQFDVVICIGVLQHTHDPNATFRSIYKHCKPGGKIIIWAYSAEGNALVRFLVEPMRALFLRGKLWWCCLIWQRS